MRLASTISQAVKRFLPRWLREPRRWLLEPLHLLRQLYLEGGIQLSVPETASAEGEPLRLKATIQPDGDVVLFVSEEALGDEEAQRQLLAAMKSVEKRLRFSGQLFAGYAAYLASLGAAVYYVYDFIQDPTQALVAIALGVAGAVLPPLVRKTLVPPLLRGLLALAQRQAKKRLAAASP